MKRFTATEKWDDPWFWELSPPSKLFWQFLCDHCDNAGVIEISFKLASSKIGQPINEKHLSELSSRLHNLSCGKVIIIGFIRFQYGQLSRDCKPHTPVFASLAKHGLDLAQIERLCKGYPKGLETLQEKDQEKETDQDKEKEGGNAKGGIYSPESRVALHFLNEKTGKHFRELETSLAPINARLKEPGVDIEGVKQMIERQCKLWGKDSKMKEWLTPTTLFRPENFNNYYAAKDQPVNENNGANHTGSFKNITGNQQRAIGIPVRDNEPDIGELLRRKELKDAATK